MMTPLGSLFLLTCGLLIEHASGVVELTDLNFFDYAKDKDVLLVDFYAPWCSDCKALDPDFENAAANLGTRSVDLAKVDCFGTGKGLCSTYGVRKWPTLKNFNRGQYTGDYTGGLSTAEIAGYITTVENSAHPSVVNPYAVAAPAASAALTPQAAAAVAQQCVARCKISRITNKQPCYARCKPKTFGKKVPLPQPVINEKSCAKCRQPQIAGKFRHLCSPVVENQCNLLMAGIWNKYDEKKYEKPRTQPSIVPGLFEHQGKGLVTTFAGGSKPNGYVGAFVNVPPEKYKSPNRAVPRANKLITSFNKLEAPLIDPALVRRPWDREGSVTAAKGMMLRRPAFVANSVKQVSHKEETFSVRAKGATTQAQGTAVVEEPKVVKGSVSDDIPQTAPDSAPQTGGAEETAAENLQATITPDKHASADVEPSGSDANPVEKGSPTIAGFTIEEEKGHSNASSPGSDVEPEEKQTDGSENAQLKKNINAELSSVAPGGDTAMDLMKAKAALNAHLKEQNAVTNLRGPPIIGDSTLINAIKGEAEAGEADQLNPPQNTSSVSESAAANDLNAEANALDADQLNAPLNASYAGESASLDAINTQADVRDVSQIQQLPETIFAAAENANASSNLTVPEDASEKVAEQSSAQEKSSCTNESKSIKEMEALESEIQHGVSQGPNNATAEVGTGAEGAGDMGQIQSQFIELPNNDQIATINSIESQFRNGALLGDTAQLNIPRKRIDVLPPDVAVKLPYTTDDKKEIIPMRNQLQEAVGSKRTETRPKTS